MVGDGERPSRIEIDEVDGGGERRELIVRRPDGSTYSAEFPADLDVGQVLDNGDVIAAEAPPSDDRKDT